jgi:hypothetical protein
MNSTNNIKKVDVEKIILNKDGTLAQRRKYAYLCIVKRLGENEDNPYHNADLGRSILYDLAYKENYPIAYLDLSLEELAQERSCINLDRSYDHYQCYQQYIMDNLVPNPNRRITENTVTLMNDYVSYSYDDCREEKNNNNLCRLINALILSKDLLYIM